MNGNGWKTWALIALATVLLAISGWVWSSVTSDLKTVRQLEVDVAVMKATLSRIEQRLEEVIARKQ